MKTTDWAKLPNFSEHEFLCKCGCGRADMDPEFMDKLQAIRTAVGQPMKVNSGFRCPDYNAKVSSTGTAGPHTTGCAADISASGPLALKIVHLALMVGMTGIGVAQKGDHAKRFIHLDDSNIHRRPWIWSY